MIYFKSDYMVGAHPSVMDALNQTNLLHTVGYGEDEFTAEAAAKILDICRIPDGKVYFLEGGTQTNAVTIDRLLDRNDGVVCADTAHINVHEAGAIELSGHKVIALPSHEGKISATQVKDYIAAYKNDETFPHMVRPAMVYLTYPTELGTLYSKGELEAISEVCKEEGIPLYIDGARLAYALAANPDVTLPDIARIADVFYIGGTKCGALFGEALVTRRPELLPRFDSLIKMHGAMMAKGRILAVQFLALFTNNLYLEIGRHAVDMAMSLKKAFMDKGYKLFIDSPTNQQFFILPNNLIDRLLESAQFELWGPRGKSETPVRFVTDFSTASEDIDTLLRLLLTMTSE
ncbi:MAG: aminotransferase class I/II-fold pyridoxal phosphate-dependent enzyme [Muribaculum sp.]|nr:aminotransferase class I/II-fold pyridoxal phosphate-dependent enzyme [Muribaculum sp.]